TVSVAGVASRSPSATARTATVCFPRLSLIFRPETQGFQVLPSTLHSKVAPAVGEVRKSLSLPFFLRVSTFFFGALLNAVSGATSTRYVAEVVEQSESSWPVLLARAKSGVVVA